MSQVPSNLYVAVKAGDCIKIGGCKVHVVGLTSSNRLKLRIEAPSSLIVELTKSFVRKAEAHG